MTLVLSASQLKTFERCKRLWWFEKVHKLPGRTGSYGTTFGSVLHAVLERYLQADEKGRDPEGAPLDPFPERWQWDDDGNRIDAEDEPLIHKLLADGIEAGMLVRLPGRTVEREFLVPLEIDPKLTGTHTLMRGYIDVDSPGLVQDHKSMKSSRYGLSKAKLAKDLQMLIYAKVNLDLHGGETVALRHNQFVRESGKVRVVEADVTRKQVDAHWAKVKQTARDMVELKGRGLPERDWACIDVALGDPCNMYGGCRFLSICNRDETPKKYRQRLLRLARPTPTPEESMSLEEKLAAAAARKAARGGPTVSVNPEPEPQPKKKKTGRKKSPKAKKTRKKEPDQLPASDPTPQAPRTSTSGLTILFNVVPIKGDMKPTLTAAEALRIAVEEIAGDTLETYYTKNGFDRRDALKGLAKSLSDRLGDSVLLAPRDMSTDEKDLVAALSAYSTHEYSSRV